jgi:hypothetical protein
VTGKPTVYLDVGLAIRRVAGNGAPGGVHVSVLTWSRT